MNEYNDSEELVEGKLCERGMMKEVFQDGDLKRIITATGKLECAKLLKEKEYQDFVLNFVKEKLKQHPDKREKILECFKNFLRECGYGI
jgi:hypothetical protein